MLPRLIIATVTQSQNIYTSFVKLLKAHQAHTSLIISTKRFYTTPLSGSIKDKSTPIPANTPQAPKLFPRPIRLQPAKVILGFIPNEWFLFFQPKTGVTGLGVFIFTLSTTLVSKEIYVLEHEYYNGLSVAAACTFVIKYIGKDIANYLDKGIEEYEAIWTDGKNATIKMLEELIEEEELLQYRSRGQLMLLAAKRENVALQREAVYRDRLLQVYRDTKRRLDFAVAQNVAETKIVQKHLVDWVCRKVKSSLTPQLEEEILFKCLDELQFIAKGEGGEDLKLIVQ